VFDALAAAVEELEIPVDGHALRTVIALRDRLDARLQVAVGAFDRAALWDLDGDTSMPGWLRHQAGREHAAASRLTVQARKLADLLATRQAFLDGRLSGGQVEVILANVPLRHLERFAEHEGALLESLAALDIEALRAAMVDWKAKADALDPQPPNPEHDNEVYLSSTIDGRGELRGSLHADVTAVVDAALRVADPKDFELTPAERRADALETIMRHFLDHQRAHTGGRHRPHVNVAMTYEEFAKGVGGTYPDTGGAPSPAELGALTCDCAVHRLVVEGRSAILDYGRAKRVVPTDLWNALVARDHGCRFPGCCRPAAWTDAHHVIHWRDGGPTAIANLVLLCRRHHRRLHRAGYEAKLLPDASFEVTYPDGHTERTPAPGPLAEAFRRRFGGS
jgi:hypothetical protein